MEKINAWDRESEGNEITVMNGESGLTRQRGGGETIDRRRVQSSKQSHV